MISQLAPASAPPLATTLSRLLLALMIGSLFACGGGGGGGDSTPTVQEPTPAPPPPPPPPEEEEEEEETPEPAVAVASVDDSTPPNVTLELVDVDPGTNVRVTLGMGQGVTIERMATRVNAATATFESPLGFLSGKDFLAPGDVAVTAEVIAAGETRTLDAGTYNLTGLTTPPADWPEGGAAALLAEVAKTAPLNTISSLSIVEANAGSVSTSSAIPTLNRQTEALGFKQQIINRATEGEAVDVNENGSAGAAVIDQESLASIDRFAFRLLAEATSVDDVGASSLESRVRTLASSGLNAGNYSAKAVSEAFLGGFDVEALSKEYREWVKDSGNRDSAVALSGQLSELAGASETAPTDVNDNTVASVAYLLDLTLGVIGASLFDAVGDTSLDGQSTFESETTELLAAIDEFNAAVAASAEASGTDSAIVAEVTAQSSAVITESLIEVSSVSDSVASAYSSGELPSAGIPESEFGLSVSTSLNEDSTYTVTVDTSPATDGATVNIKVSGTDAFIGDVELITVNGSASTTFPQGAPGVIDTINVIHVGGRAEASTQIQFAGTINAGPQGYQLSLFTATQATIPPELEAAFLAEGLTEAEIADADQFCDWVLLTVSAFDENGAVPNAEFLFQTVVSVDSDGDGTLDQVEDSGLIPQLVDSTGSIEIGFAPQCLTPGGDLLIAQIDYQIAYPGTTTIIQSFTSSIVTDLLFLSD